jgi:nucleotide-binding universal stress UspA family protein
MFDRILVPLDGSAPAEAALTVAEAIPSRSVRLLAVETEEDELGAICRGERGCADYLERVAGNLRSQGRAVETAVEFGDPARRIAASADSADLVIMGSHGRGGIGHVLLGSVAEWVARNAPAPTMIVRGGQRPAATLPLTRIVVLLDGSPRADEALPAAMALADVLGLPIHVVRVVVVDPGRAVGGTVGRIHLRAWESTIRAASAYLADVVQMLRNRNFAATSETRSGPLIGELLAAIRAGDVVVLATRERGRVERWWLGSVGKELIARAAAPVVVVKARGAAPAKIRHERAAADAAVESAMTGGRTP